MIAICTLVSRLTGLVRDMLMSQTYGLSVVFDAFNYAFQFPNLFRRLFGEGALAAAFVPVFTRAVENDGREAAWRMLARSLALMTVALISVIVLIELVLLGIWFFVPAATAEQMASRGLMLSLTAIMLPFMLTICVVALFSSVLNCLGSFAPAALTPVILNVLMIAGILVIGPQLGSAKQLDRQIFGVAISVIAAGLLQLAFLLPVLRAHGVALGWKLDMHDPHVRKVLGLMVPVLLGQGVLILGPFLDTNICWLFSAQGGPTEANWFGVAFTYPLREGALSALANAQRLYQFPLGVFAISLAVAALPTLTRLANRADWVVWSGELVRTLRLAILIGVVTGAMMTVWSEPIVRMLFEYRRFDAADTTRVADVMFWYGLGLWAFCAHHIVLRGFYSLSDIRTPLLISCLLLPVNLAISLVLIWTPALRESAFAISSTITSAATVVIGLALLQRRTSQKLITAELCWGATRMAIAGAGGALALWWLGPSIAALADLEAIWLGRAIETVGGLVLGSMLCVLAGGLLGLPEPARLIRRRRKAQI
jgi:putative peptidoglycan lipid II flippase